MNGNLAGAPALSLGSGTLRAARQRVLAVLPQIRGGQLQLVEGDDVQLFGIPLGPDPIIAVLQVLAPEAYWRILSRGTVGAAEAYMAGELAAPDWVSVVRLLARNLELVDQLDAGPVRLWQWWQRLRHWRRRNTPVNASENIRAHYDLSNEFFQCFLDRRLMYSAAIFPEPGADLDRAAEYKLKRVCDLLCLHPDDHLLEIGSGWGGLAVYAARHYGCRVTTVTLSKAQFEYARVQVTAAGLAERVVVRLADYRQLSGRYSKLVSIEMVEAVGHEYYPLFFRQCGQLLAPDGLMLLQAITMPEQRVAAARQRVDFIQRYVFPGGCLPALTEICAHVGRQTQLQLVRLDDISGHYAETLEHWRRNFWRAEPQVRSLGFSDEFLRMWDFYLAYCEGAFSERAIGCAQMLFAGQAARLPLYPLHNVPG